MKWLLVVVSLIGSGTPGESEMWVVAKFFDSKKQCIIDANRNTIGLLARAHQEYNYYNRYPNLTPWDSWQIYCLTQKQFTQVLEGDKNDVPL